MHFEANKKKRKKKRNKNNFQKMKTRKHFPNQMHPNDSPFLFELAFHWAVCRVLETGAHVLKGKLFALDWWVPTVECSQVDFQRDKILGESSRVFFFFLISKPRIHSKKAKKPHSIQDVYKAAKALQAKKTRNSSPLNWRLTTPGIL